MFPIDYIKSENVRIQNITIGKFIQLIPIITLDELVKWNLSHLNAT